MFFLQAAQAPIIVTHGDKLLTVTKFSLQDVIDWAVELKEAHTAEVTAGMEDAKRREYLTFYPPVQPDVNEMKRHLKTPDGVKKVFRQCLLNASVKNKQGHEQPRLTESDVDTIMATNGFGRCHGIAVALADMEDTSAVDPGPPSNESGADPLT